MPNFNRAFKHWLDASWYGLGSGVFGWGGIAGAAIFGSVSQRYASIAVYGQDWPWIPPLASAIFAVVIVAMINAVFLAPIRAWRMLHPFKIKLVSGQLETVYPGESFPRQSAAVLIENASYKQRPNCVLHICSIADFDNQHHALPRQVCEFSLLSGEIKQIAFLTWTTRNPPLSNDIDFQLSGPTGWGLDGNLVNLPIGSYDIDIRVGIHQSDPVVLRCQVWVDSNNLRATLR